MSGTQSNAIARSIDSLSGRNRIINGSTLIVQRSNGVFTNSTSGYGGPDRWYCSNNAAGGQFTQSSGTITYGGATRPAVVQTSNTPPSTLATTSYWIGFLQRIEGSNCYDLVGQPMSLSFIFNTNVTGNFSVAIRDSASAQSYVTYFSATANVPAKYTFLIPANSTLSIPNSTASGMTVTIGALNQATYQTSTYNVWQSGNFISATIASNTTNWGVAANNFIAITDVQLEVGNIATAFERRNASTEFVLCQRYYQTFAGTLLILSTEGSFGGALVPIFNGQTMRISPALTVTNTNSTGGYTGTLSCQAFTPNSYQVWLGTGTQTLGAYCQFSLICNAEL